MANPFSSYAAGSSNNSGGGNNSNNNDGGWLSTRKTKDEIKKAAVAAREARKNKSSRGGKKTTGSTDKKGSKGGGQRGGGGNKKKKGNSRDDSWMAESSEEEDFIIEESETEDEGEWDGEESNEEELDISEGEDEDSDEDYQHKKKSKNKKAAVAAVRSDIRNRRNAVARNKNVKNSVINVDDDTTDDEGKGADVDTSMDDIFDEDKNELIVRKIKETKGQETKSRSPYFSSGFDEKKDDDDDDGGGSRSDDPDMMADNNDFNRTKVTSKRRRMILSDGDDESSDEDMSGQKQSSMKLGKRPKASSLGDDDEEDALADTPAKANGQYQSFSGDDFVDDEEAKAIEKAMKYSIKDETKRKRLKKMGGRGDSLASLNRKEQKQKKKTVYKDDLEDDESIIDVDDDEGNEEDEDDVFEVVNEEEQTASEVLNEAIALSAKIVKTVSGWCGGEVGKVQGLILGEGDGTLNLAGDSAGGDGGGAKNERDKTWISKETMKQVLPTVELADYQLLGVNWMALLNRVTFGSRSSKKMTDGRDGGVAVNGILADEVRHILLLCVPVFLVLFC